ncbi:MAG: response regulator [Owenweeksia sp.]
MALVKVLIVEDEVLVGRDIAARLKNAGYHIVDCVDTGREALHTLEKEMADIVLLDINLIGDMDGIETAEKIRARYELPIIFLTSLSDQETAERAKNARPAAYMLKPFNERQLHIAIQLAVSNYASQKPAVLPHEKSEKTVGDQEEHYLLNDSIFIRNRNRFEKVPFKAIQWLQADSNCTHIHTEEGKYFLTVTLGVIMDRLKYEQLVRTHRSYAINITHVTSFEGNCLFVGKQEIPVSRNYRDEVFRNFQTL